MSRRNKRKANARENLEQDKIRQIQLNKNQAANELSSKQSKKNEILNQIQNYKIKCNYDDLSRFFYENVFKVFKVFHSAQNDDYNDSYSIECNARSELYSFIFQYIQKYQKLIRKEVLKEIEEKWYEQSSWKLTKVQKLNKK